MGICVPLTCVKLTTTFSVARSLEFGFRTDYHLCALGVAGSVAWRSLCDEIPIKNQRIESRCVERPDRIEW